jgi:hypothetical protein
MHIIDERVFRTMKFHVFDSESRPRAVLMDGEDAAAFVAILGDGACIADPNGAIVWSEGAEEFPAADSYDGVAEIMQKRLAKINKGRG